ncbi:hypothetical protein V5799_005609 [Amblyomma americanum]|uniref:Uncharacterized protein n=1 Tax=Amblyomma americanum TaxID=6943 RepID=A0AAQ4DYR9_AMBAM
MPTYGALEPFHGEGGAWTEYLERVKLFFDANSVPEEKKKSVFVTCCGSSTYSLLRSLLTPKTPDQVSIDEIFSVLSGHYIPKPSVVVCRFRFNSRSRQPEESVSYYTAALKKLSANLQVKAISDAVAISTSLPVNGEPATVKLAFRSDVSPLDLAVLPAREHIIDWQPRSPLYKRDLYMHQTPPATPGSRADKVARRRHHVPSQVPYMMEIIDAGAISTCLSLNDDTGTEQCYRRGNTSSTVNTGALWTSVIYTST